MAVIVYKNTKIEIERWRNLRKKILKRDNYTCKGCGRTHLYEVGTFKDRRFNENDNNFLDVDHIISLMLGGNRWDLNNLQTLCLKCHKKKTKKDKTEIAKAIKKGAIKKEIIEGGGYILYIKGGRENGV